MKKCENCKRSKHRTEEEKKYLKTRLNTIEGQVRGVSKMVEEERDKKRVTGREFFDDFNL